MIAGLVIPTVAILAVVCAVAVVHVAAVHLLRALTRRYSPAAETVALAVVTLAGLPAVWYVTRLVIPDMADDEILIQFAATALYAAGCIVYLEIRSLVSRGYSLRILNDLLSLEGSAPMPQLKSNYGGGVGMTGLLTKRIRTLERLGVLSFDGERVGPLSAFGRVVAFAVVGMRRLLRLELVG